MPDHARLLRDPEGKFMCVGDSASLSLLQRVSRIVSRANGEFFFTAPIQPIKPTTNFSPLVYDVELLADQYVLATTGLMDPFDTTTFSDDLEV